LIVLFVVFWLIQAFFDFIEGFLETALMQADDAKRHPDQALPDEETDVQLVEERGVFCAIGRGEKLDQSQNEESHGDEKIDRLHDFAVALFVVFVHKTMLLLNEASAEPRGKKHACCLVGLKEERE
jgi:hypothetical protein